jgi:hypothetical protein
MTAVLAITAATGAAHATFFAAADEALADGA